MSRSITESSIEQAVLDILSELGYKIIYGPDVVLFINGLPLAVIELKNPADENATVKSAFNQFETYKIQISSLFRFNEILVISDGIEAKSGTISSDWERFLPWKTIDGIEKVPTAIPQIEVLLKGVFDKAIFLDLVRHFIVFEKEGGKLIKKIAAYHQYHAVNAAVMAYISCNGTAATLIPNPSPRWRRETI